MTMKAPSSIPWRVIDETISQRRSNEVRDDPNRIFFLPRLPHLGWNESTDTDNSPDSSFSANASALIARALDIVNGPIGNMERRDETKRLQ